MEFVTAVFQQDGTDLEEVRGIKWRVHVYLKIDVERMPQVGWMVLTLQLLMARWPGKCATHGLIIVVTGRIMSKLLTVDSIMFTNSANLLHVVSDIVDQIINDDWFAFTVWDMKMLLSEQELDLIYSS